MEILIVIFGILIVALLGVLIALVVRGRETGTSDADRESLLREMDARFAKSQRETREELSASLTRTVGGLGELMMQNQKLAAESQAQKLEAIDKSLCDRQDGMRRELLDKIGAIEPRLKTLEQTNEQKLDGIRNTVSERLTYIQEDNNKKLEAIQQVVDEKLQKTLEDKMNESFKLVSERLEQVYTGLGEMKTIAVGVGDLKKVLSNVKNRGILGEIQLGAILSDILSPEQYDTDVATVKGSANRVEFAVKLPGANEGETVYLPIDSKFPGDTYAALQDAYQSGSPEAIAAAKKNLEVVVKKCAKDIRDKYVRPPYTTNFGIMFLPFEGLYAEVVNGGMVEVLQREYGINVTGPSTMAAMLNSLQMGFRTLAIQKRSNEVWTLLGKVKGEFETFEAVLSDTQKRLRKVDEDLDKLVGVRTRQITRRLRDVEVIEEAGDAPENLS